MSERNIIRFTVGLTAILAVLLIGFALGSRPEGTSVTKAGKRNRRQK